MKTNVFSIIVAVALATVMPAKLLAQIATHTTREIQQSLLDRGFAPGAVDGVWGKKSSDALKAFQRSRGLPLTGTVDANVTLELFAPVQPQVRPAPTEPQAAPVQRVERGSRTPAAPPVEPAVPVKVSEPNGPPPPQVATKPAEVLSSGPSALGAPDEPGNGFAAGLILVGAAVLLYAYRKRRRNREDVGSTADGVAGAAAFAEPRPPARTNSRPVGSGPPLNPGKSFSPLTGGVAATVAKIDAVGAVEFERIMASDTNTLEHAAHAPGSQVAATALPLAVDAKQMAASGRPLFGTMRRAGENALRLAANHSGWVPAGTVATVANIPVPGGMIYVGGNLPKQGTTYENENCLINSKLPVSKSRDPYGTTMGYWPSYSQLTPEARASYLDWLSGSRSDPNAYIGFVFLYFYGLERRLMLEADASDAVEVLGEVRRLLEVYGHHHSFNRYAYELLSAAQLRTAPQDPDFIPDAEGNGFEVPMAMKLALGLRVMVGRPFEPELLFNFARSHPETRIRTPARRVPELLRSLFIARINELHPGGVYVKAGRFKALTATYRACSGSFIANIVAMGGTVPDISERAEPITTARAVFDRCSEELDDYSRALGRSPGLKPTFSVVARLPANLRRHAAEALPGKPRSRLEKVASEQTPVTVRDIAGIMEFDLGTSVGKSKLRDMSRLLAAFSFGHTADPAYALRLATADEQVIVFALERPTDQMEPSEGYRPVQLSVMLGMVVGHADGSFDDHEKRSLFERIDQSPDITADERVRLKAEVRLTETDGSRLSEWTKRLKEVPASARNTLAAELVALAAADGTVHAAEVKSLEGLFKRMGLDQQSLYLLLHEHGGSRKNDELSVVIEPTESPVGSRIPAEPGKASGARIDISRLNAIRSETKATASVLADIFVEETDAYDTSSTTEADVGFEDDDVFDGLERRYGSLVLELRSRDEWPASDFESLVRDAGLMPGAARDAINEWSMDHFDELFVEGDGPFVINSHLLPPFPTSAPTPNIESASA